MISVASCINAIVVRISRCYWLSLKATITNWFSIL
jgi:hypothetical protein